MEEKFQRSKQLEVYKLCAALSNTTRIAILEQIANSESCITGDFVGMKEVSKFTVGQKCETTG